MAVHGFTCEYVKKWSCFIIEMKYFYCGGWDRNTRKTKRILRVGRPSDKGRVSSILGSVDGDSG